MPWSAKSVRTESQATLLGALRPRQFPPTGAWRRSHRAEMELAKAHLDIRTSRPTTTPRDRTTAPTLLPFSHTTARMASVQSVQCFGKKKTATAVAHCKAGKGLIKVNGQPLSLVEPQVLRFKVYEPVLLLGLDKFGTFASKEDVEGSGNVLED